MSPRNASAVMRDDAPRLLSGTNGLAGSQIARNRASTSALSGEIYSQARQGVNQFPSGVAF